MTCCWSVWRSPSKTAIRALRRGFEAGMQTILNPAPAPALSEPEVEELLSAATHDHAEPRRGPGAGRHDRTIRGPSPIGRLAVVACRRWGRRRW